MRLREFLELQSKNNKSLQEGKKVGEVDLDSSKDDEEEDSDALFCDYCYKRIYDSSDLSRTIYGTLICEDCWDTYINTSEALAEYVLGIADGSADINDFPEEELEDMAKSGNENKTYFAMSDIEIKDVEAKAIANGFKF